MESFNEAKEMNENGLHITLEGKELLREAGKWAKFISIIGFIGIGLMVILSFFMGTIMSIANYAGGGGSPLPGWAFTIIYLALAVLYAFPVYYLYQFSNNVKKALEMDNTGFLTNSFNYLKSHYKFIGILTIILMAIYAFFLVILLFAGVFAALAS